MGLKMNKKINTLLTSIICTSLMIILSINLISADSSVNSCCEKEKTGAWCQNSPASDCNADFRITPTSCDATSFCKKGCCIDTQEGLCMENTPEKVCEMGTGTWVDDSECNSAVVPQCRLGCCILGDQASFVTLTRCKKLSSFYGLTTNFKTNIRDEPSCILEAQRQDKGACVFEIENQKTCKFSTREECINMNKKGTNISVNTQFFKDLLCSADELGTNCGPTTQTTCVDGKNEVYFVDTCGNPANIYDANKAKDPSYWKKIVPKSESCEANSDNGNLGSRNCGNCEYYRGSICAKGTATYGNYACKDLNCYNTENGKNYKNGESWCIYQGDVGLGVDSVGSRHFRHICFNGEEIIEACADFKNEICIQNQLQTSDGNFEEAACRINRWQDCIDQDNKEDCLNKDKRDCYWTRGLGLEFLQRTSEQPSTTTGASSSTSSSAAFSGSTSSTFSGGTTLSGSASVSTTKIIGGLQLADNKDVCLPTVPPGLRFWNSGDASSICSLGSSVCNVEYDQSLFDQWGDRKGNCVENCTCLTEEWVGKMNKVCTSLGDCGANINVAGRYTNNGVEWKEDGEKQTITRSLLNDIKRYSN
jgi:hypothetical protein